MISHDICLSLSDSLHLVRSPLGPSVSSPPFRIGNGGPEQESHAAVPGGTWVHPASWIRAGTPPSQPCREGNAMRSEMLCSPSSLCANPQQTNPFSWWAPSSTPFGDSYLFCINTLTDVLSLLTKVPTYKTRQGASWIVSFSVCSVIWSTHQMNMYEQSCKPHLYYFSGYLLSSYIVPRMSLGDGPWQRR